MIKKRGGLITFASGLLISMISFVSAQFGFFNTKGITDSVINFYKEFFGPVFAALFGQYSTDEFLFAKILLFFLLLLIIYFILQKSKIFKRKKGITFLVSLIVSLLALRYLPENDLINGILLPYGVLGVALITFLPFLIYSFFVHQSVPGGFGRRAAWALYGIVFLVLLGFRWGDISPISEWIYLSGVILVIVAFLFDKSIHGYFASYELGRFRRGVNVREIAHLQAEYSNLSDTGADTDYIKERKAQIEERLEELGAGI